MNEATRSSPSPADPAVASVGATVPTESRPAKRHLSFTQLNMFLRCPRQYEYRYVRGLKVPPSGAMVQSRVWHQTVELNYRQKIQSDRDLALGEMQEFFAAQFDVLRASTADEVMEAAQWLLTHPHGYRTLVIDPITVYWDALQKKWSDVFLRRNKGSKGHKFEFYDLQPRDWMTVKAEFKDCIRKLIALDMNVIVTARQKVQYADGAFMKAIGETFDGEKSLPYLFDTIVRLYRDEKGRFLGECLKDRSNKLPLGEFECSFARFEELFGKKTLARKARPTAFASDEQKRQIREHIARFEMTPEQVVRRLAAYGAESLDELTEENARVILTKFESALANREANQSGKEA